MGVDKDVEFGGGGGEKGTRRVAACKSDADCSQSETQSGMAPWGCNVLCPRIADAKP